MDHPHCPLILPSLHQPGSGGWVPVPASATHELRGCGEPRTCMFPCPHRGPAAPHQGLRGLGERGACAPACTRTCSSGRETRSFSHQPGVGSPLCFTIQCPANPSPQVCPEKHPHPPAPQDTPEGSLQSPPKRAMSVLKRGPVRLSYHLVQQDPKVGQEKGGQSSGYPERGTEAGGTW